MIAGPQIGGFLAILWSDKEGRVRQWKLDENQVNYVEGTPPNVISVAALADDQRWLVFVTKENEVGVWDYDEEPTHIVINEGHEISLLDDRLDPTATFSPVTHLVSSWRSGVERLVWTRDDGTISGWSANDDADASNLARTNPHGANQVITALEAAGRLVVSTTAVGEIIVWDSKPLDPGEDVPIHQRMQHPVDDPDKAGVIGLAVLGNRRIVSARRDGSLLVWQRPPESPDAVQVGPIGTLATPGGRQVKSIISLHKDLVAVLYEDQTIVQYEVPDFDTDTVIPAETLDTGDVQAEQLGIFKRPGTSNRQGALIVSGPTSTTRLVGLLTLDGQLRMELTGRLVLQDNLAFRQQVTGDPICTHRVELFFDRARVPLNSIYNGRVTAEHPVGCLAKHTFRFSGNNAGQFSGPQERVWEAPQIVTFTNLINYAQHVLGIPAAQLPAEEDLQNRLLIDAGSVFWLNSDRRPAEFSVGAARIENSRFRLLLQPRELRHFEADPAFEVRLPAATSWGFDNAPLEVERPDKAVRHDLRLEDVAADYKTSGAQHSLVDAQLIANPLFVDWDASELRGEDRVTYFDRTSEAAWLDAKFLRYTLLPEDARRRLLLEELRRSGRGVAPADNPLAAPAHESGLSPAFSDPSQTTPRLPDALPDLGWMNDVEIDDANEPLEGVLRGRTAPLAAATLARKHDHGESEQTLSGATSFEFPFQVRQEHPFRPRRALASL